MPDIDPVESGDMGVSIWTVVAVVVGVLVLDYKTSMSGTLALSALNEKELQTPATSTAG